MTRGGAGSETMPSIRERGPVCLFGKHPCYAGFLQERSVEWAKEPRPLTVLRACLQSPGLLETPSSLGVEFEAPKGIRAGFGHSFVWWFRGRVWAGRIWDSSDSEGKRMFPLVLAAEIVPWRERSQWVSAVGHFREVEAAVVAASSREAVAAAVRRDWSTPEVLPSPELSVEPAAALLESADPDNVLAGAIESSKEAWERAGSRAVSRPWPSQFRELMMPTGSTWQVLRAVTLYFAGAFGRRDEAAAFFADETGRLCLIAGEPSPVDIGALLRPEMADSGGVSAADLPAGVGSRSKQAAIEAEQDSLAKLCDAVSAWLRPT
mgnify:CR=1 FL=1